MTSLSAGIFKVGDKIIFGTYPGVHVFAWEKGGLHLILTQVVVMDITILETIWVLQGSIMQGMRMVMQKGKMLQE